MLREWFLLCLISEYLLVWWKKCIYSHLSHCKCKMLKHLKDFTQRVWKHFQPSLRFPRGIRITEKSWIFRVKLRISPSAIRCAAVNWPTGVHNLREALVISQNLARRRVKTLHGTTNPTLRPPPVLYSIKFTDDTCIYIAKDPNEFRPLSAWRGMSLLWSHFLFLDPELQASHSHFISFLFKPLFL